MTHTFHTPKSPIPRIARIRDEKSSYYFEEIDQVLERRIEETKEELKSQDTYQPTTQGHWIFVR